MTPQGEHRGFQILAGSGPEPGGQWEGKASTVPGKVTFEAGVLNATSEGALKAAVDSLKRKIDAHLD